MSRGRMDTFDVRSDGGRFTEKLCFDALKDNANDQDNNRAHPQLPLLES